MKRIAVVGLMVWLLIAADSYAQCSSGKCPGGSCPAPIGAQGSGIDASVLPGQGNGAQPPFNVTPDTPVTPIGSARAPALNKQAITRVYIQYKNGREMPASATLLQADADGALVLTSARTVGDPRNIAKVRIWYPSVGFKTGTIEDVDADLDLVAIRTETPPDVLPLTLANDAPDNGTPLYLVGYDAEGTMGLTNSLVTSGGDFVVADCAVPAGYEGGPMLGADGNVVGITSHVARPLAKAAGPGPVRKFLAKLHARRVQVRANRQARRVVPIVPVNPNVIVPPDPQAGQALNQIAQQGQQAEQHLQSLDDNVADIKSEIKSDEEGLNPVGVALAVAVALVLGAVIFFAGFKNTPIS